MITRKQRWSKLGAAWLCLLPGLLSAAPVDGVFTYHQPDGSKLSVRVRGDEFFAEEETLDGQRIVQDPVTRFWCYAKLSDDGTDLESTGMVAGDKSPRAFASGEFAPGYLRVKTPRELRKRIDQANRERFDRDHRGRFRDQEVEGLLPAAAPSAGAITVQPMVSNTTLGGKRGLTILIRFPDRASDVTISRAQVESYCNQTSTHYTEFGNNGSVSEYFLDVSNGKLNYTNTVADYYTTKNNRAYYTDETQARAPELVKDALNALESAGFDFRSVDADGNGAIDALNIFYAGPVVNAWAKGLWPHASGISWTSARTGIRARGYQISAIGSKLELGTFCHENGHMLCGFPDVYDYDGDSVGGGGSFDLMCGGGHGTNPRGPNAYLRYKAGWGSVEWLGGGVNATKSLTAESGGRLANQFIGYANPANAKEYFLIESFYKNDRHSGAPTGGMAVWHVDEQGDHNKQNYAHNTTHNNYEVALIQADNLRQFERNAGGGDARDLFYAGNTAAGYLNEFSDTSDSSAYDNNAHWWSGTKSGLKLSGFSGQGNTMSVIVQTPGSVSLSASPTAFSFTSAAGSKTCAITSNVAWKAAANQSWISVSPASGSANATLTITVQANTSASARSGQITLTGTGASPVTLSVSQSGVSSILAANPTSFSFAAASGSKTSAITANVAWKAAANQSWIAVSPASGSANATLTITVQANTGASARSGQISLTGTGASAVTLTVSQSGNGVTYAIKNRWLGTYLCDGGDQLKYGSSIANSSYKWILEDLSSGRKELRNVGTGQYIHIENLQDWAQCTARTPGWWSSRWTLEDAGNGFIRFKNYWQPNNYLHVEGRKGYVQRGPLGNAGWWSAQWQLVSVQ